MKKLIISFIFLAVLTVAVAAQFPVNVGGFKPAAAAGGGNVTFAAKVGSGTERGSTSVTFPVTVASNANRYMVIGIGSYIPGLGTISGVTVNGSAATLLVTRLTEGDTQIVSLWGFVAPPVGTYNVFVTVTAVSNSLSAGAAVFYNVNQTTPASNATSATADTVNVTSATGNMVVDMFVTWPENTYIQGSGQTLVFQLNDLPGDPGSISSMSYEAGATSVTMNWTPASTTPSIAGVSLNKAP